MEAFFVLPSALEKLPSFKDVFCTNILGKTVQEHAEIPWDITINKRNKGIATRLQNTTGIRPGNKTLITINKISSPHYNSSFAK